MNKIIKIAVDAMGGDGSPKKVIDGIHHHFKNNKNSFYQIFGDKDKILPHIKNNLSNSSFEIIHTLDIVKGTDSPLEGAKRGKNTSMWLAIQNVKEKKSDVVISAGNTGALLVISKLNLNPLYGLIKQE
jgi:glycerol-3-phosphate acyltransferase PlsX